MEAAVAAAMRHTVAPTASSRDPGQAHCSAAAAQSHDDAVIRLQYSMIIVRLVNGIADAGQKGRTANSVASITAAAGAPKLQSSRGAPRSKSRPRMSAVYKFSVQMAG